MRRAIDAIDLIVRSDPVGPVPESHHLISGDVIIVPDSRTRWNVEQDLLLRILSAQSRSAATLPRAQSLRALG